MTDINVNENISKYKTDEFKLLQSGRICVLDHFKMAVPLNAASQRNVIGQLVLQKQL